MTRSALGACIAAIGIVACGGSAAAPQGPTTANVAVQPGDLPSGMVRCDLTGDISNFIKQEQSPDPQIAKSTAGSWSDLQKSGATSAYVGLYTDSGANCSDIKSSATNPAAATYRLAVSFVVQFKSETAAANAYANDQIFNFSSSNLRSGQAHAIVGASTGLTANSVALSQSIGNQTFYVAMWQNKAFVVILAVFNLDPAASKKVATGENSRIK